MDAEIIAVGSELLLGQIANTNGQFLSKQLAELGINVYYHTVVGDNSSRLENAISIAQTRADLIIFTGGLGPTKDDLTKETIAKILGKKLVTDAEALEGIEEYFIKTKRIMTENNKKQALVIEGSDILSNDHGMAPGMGFIVDNITYMLFPGPPKELNPMFLKYGSEFLLKQIGEAERIESRVLRFFGIGESQLETEIEDLIEAQTNPTIAPLAGDGEVTLRLTAKHRSPEIAKKLLDETEGLIADRVGEYIYGYDSTSLVDELMNRLKGMNLTISGAESLTGGLFLEELTRLSGASAVIKGGVVCYTNEIKEHVLGVNKSTLETKGAVSEETAEELATKVRKILQSDIGISFTGVAGPNESEGKPVGTVIIGISCLNYPTKVYPLLLTGTRQGIRTRTVKYGCYYLLKMLKELDS
ncbi:competence/damage-inducible protein A [Fredinandcohnia quinoae]|uniref:Putative competence-damage inducible protein n=1 Tax=Fredinandcohnia quinoae TaxID=2918902 RepID=A0AAW5E2X2_9BACI|nr:competence/damage-inducible protein A [Fredinandcohnia sp. SECRCQ15]MCH1623711.1 competence/damage-inducible protein A [Fredinandcohnia sp. SECRCQ15]